MPASHLCIPGPGFGAAERPSPLSACDVMLALLSAGMIALAAVLSFA
jgi:hypothetical protein